MNQSSLSLLDGAALAKMRNRVVAIFLITSYFLLNAMEKPARMVHGHTMTF